MISLIFNIKTLDGFKTTIWGTNTQLPIGSFIEAFCNFIILSFTIFVIVELSEKSNLLVEKEVKEEVKQLQKTNESFEKQIYLQQKQLEVMERILQMQDPTYVKQEINLKEFEIKNKENPQKSSNNDKQEKSLKSKLLKITKMSKDNDR